MDVQRFQLNNGLRVIATPTRQTAFIAIQLIVRAGSRVESQVESGLSHFVEHLLFRGSPSFPSGTLLNEKLETLGDGLQGATTREYSLYSLEVPPENFEAACEVLGELFSRPLLCEIGTEKGIVIEEIQEELDEEGKENLLENVSRMRLFRSSLGQPILGREPTVQAFDDALVRSFYARTYRSGNLVLALAGNLNANQNWREVLEINFGKIGDSPGELLPLGGDIGGVSKVLDSVSSVLSIEDRSHWIDESSSQIETLLSFYAYGENAPEYFSQLFLERILDDGLSSRLQRNLCENRGLLYDVHAGVETFSDCGVFDLGFRVREKNLLEVLRLIFGELTSLKRELVPEREFQKVQGRMLREVDMLFESARNLSQRLAEIEIFGLPFRESLEFWRESVGRVTREQVRHSALQIFRDEGMFLGLQGRLRKGRLEKVLELRSAGF